MSDPAHEAPHSRLINLDDLIGDLAMGGAVNGVDRFRVRPLGKAEGALALVIEPAIQVLDAVPALKLQILQVRPGHIDGGRAGKLVTVHVQGHPGDSMQESGM